MKLNELTKIIKNKSKIIGRGYGSGKGGHTVGKGQKGQKSRSGYKKLRSWFRESKVKSLPKLKGIGKRTAKRMFFNKKINEYVFNVKDLDSFHEGSIIDVLALKKNGYIKSKSKNISVKVLGKGELRKKIYIKGIKVSKTARKKIEKVGGKVL